MPQGTNVVVWILAIVGIVLLILLLAGGVDLNGGK